MRSRALNRLAKQQAIKLQERANAEFDAIKGELKQAMTDEDERTIRALGDAYSNDALYAALRPLAERAGLVGQFENMWQLLSRVDKLNGV